MSDARRFAALLPLTALLLLAPAMLAGCSSDDDTSACSDCGPGPKRLTITIESSMTPAVGERARLRATVDAYPYMVTAYSWTVDAPDGAPLQPDDEGEGRIGFALDRGAGSYSAHCVAQLETGHELQASATLTASGGPELSYTARIDLPPELGAPPVDMVARVGGGDMTGLLWVVTPGAEVELEVARAPAAGTGTDGPPQLLPAFVRLTRPGQRALPRDLYLAEGVAKVRISGAFDALVVPEGSEVAPAVRTGLDEATLGAGLRIALDAGIGVSGRVDRGPGAPLDGAVVTLQTADDGSGLVVPSTVGRSGKDGAFTVRARPGRARLTVTPPRSSNLPVAVVAADGGLALAGPAEGWVFSFNPPTTGPAAATVVRSDGLTPAGATVILRSRQPLADVGQLLVDGASFGASGHYRRVLASTSKGGALVDPTTGGALVVPLGSYEVVLLPGADEDASQGRAVHELVVTADAPAAPRALALAARVELSGTVLGHDGAPARARIQAAGALESYAGLTDGQGHFSLRVDDSQSYALVIRPEPAPTAAAAGLGPLLLPEVAVTGDLRLDRLVLPRAVTLSGQLKTSGAAGIGGALIRIRCSGAGCPGDQVVDEARTGADGSFTLKVPRP